MSGTGVQVTLHEAAERVAEAASVMAHLRGPGGCPWDREQTFDSIKPNTLEETYEVFDAIERRAWPDLKDELGDMLLQVLFYTQMATEAGYFTLADVAQGLTAKLVRRHPHVFGYHVFGDHVFGDKEAKDAAAMQKTWDAVKMQEKAAAQVAPRGLLDDVSRAMPAMIEASKLGSRAARVGFDWPEASGLIAKMREEIAELEAELAGGTGIEDEFGDVLFTAVNLARHIKVDPETALRRANAKFRARFGAMEAAVGGRLDGLSKHELEQLWTAAKQKLSAEDDAS